MPTVTLITGGSRSGKSRHALALAGRFHRKAFLATAEPIDDEMKERISNHKNERGDDFLTIEEPLRIAKALQILPSHIEVAVLDCLTVWLGNLIFHESSNLSMESEVEELLKLLKDPPCTLIIVTNEVGMGIIPGNQSAREYRDMAGWLNQNVAKLADEVVLMVSGIAMAIKENTNG